jgi:chromodomain-helicase-DNA-binding protein 1
MFDHSKSCQAYVPALAAFPTRKDRSDSSDDDYGAKSHKKKKSARNSAQATPESGLADQDAGWRRGAAKKVVTYDEAEVDYGLESAEEEEKLYQAQEIAAFGGAADEIDQVLSHSRDEERLADPEDIPQENLVSSLVSPQTWLTDSASTSNGRDIRICIIPTSSTLS